MLKITGWERKADALTEYSKRSGRCSEVSYDEVRVHACLALVRHIIEVFLVDELSVSGGMLWQQLLSPDLVTREGRLSLLDIEMNLRHRRISRQRNSVSTDGCSVAGSSGSYPTGKSSGAASSALRSSNPKLVSVGSSNALGSSTPSGATRNPSNKSLPRNWGKNYTAVPRRTSTSFGGEGKSGSVANIGASAPVSASQISDEDDLGDYDVHMKYLYRIVAVTMLRTLRTAVDQFEWVIRLIEEPFDCRCGGHDQPKQQTAASLESVTVDQAYAFLGSLTDLLFLLIKRANTIETLYSSFDGDVEEDADEDEEDEEDKDQCFLNDLFQYLEIFLVRFQRALFACRIADLPLIHDRCRVQLLLTIAATGKSIGVRQHAAKLLCKLIAVCYDQTGSFLLMKRPIFKVFCSLFFSSGSGQPVLPTESLRDAVEEMRQYPFTEDNATQAFHIQFKELLNGLITQIKVFEMWQVAVATPEQLRDYEEIEEGLFRIVRAISPFWLLEEKKIWLDALLRLHIIRQKYAEAACCKLECIEFTKQIVQDDERGEFLCWEVKELAIARELAEKAAWMEQQIAISEQLLSCLKEQKRYSEYLETLKYLERAIYHHAEAEAVNGGYGNGHAFYRVAYTGDCVSTHISKHEYIYKRNKFMSLGEFVSEMKAMLRVKYPISERVDVVPESKPLIGDDQPNVIFMRVTSVEQVKKGDRATNSQQDPCTLTVFKFAMPFTLGSSSYGRTCEQMKRMVYLSVAQPFPCTLNRQVVVERREEIRCPIENSMDDIQKRCLLLQDEINKEIQRRTDLKTLTLVLKGSVDTHVHGGIPEVVESFLASIAVNQDPESDVDQPPVDRLPPLLDARGAVMSADESMQKRHHLANLLVHFLKLCWQCLLISREAYRRASSQSSIISANSAPGFTISQLQTNSESSSFISSSSISTPFTPGGPANVTGSSNKLSNSSTSGLLTMSMLPDDDSVLSPLQLEFEKSFASLVDLIQSKVSFHYESAGDVTQLLQQMQVKRMGSIAPNAQPTASVASPTASGAFVS